VYAKIGEKGIEKTISKIITYLSLCFYFVALGIVMISRDLLDIIAPQEYFGAYYFIFLMLPGLAFRGIFYIGESLLNIRNKSHIVGSTVLIFTLLSIGLSYLTIKHYGIYGAVFVLNFNLIMTGCAVMYLGRKAVHIDIEWKRIAIILAITTLSFSCVYYLRDKGFVVYYSLTTLIMLSAMLYLVFGNFCNEDERRTIKLAVNQVAGKIISSKT